MPVVAHSEKELLTDAFGDGERFECDYYTCENGKMAWIRRNEIKYYDLIERNMILEADVEGPREIKMTPDGEYVGVLTSRNELFVFNKTGDVLRKSGVLKFKMSDCLIAYISQDSFCVHRIKGMVEDVPFHDSKVSVLEFYPSGSILLLATQRLSRDGQFKILKIDGDSVEVLHGLEVLQGFTLKTHVSGDYMLFLLMTSYVNDSYFAESCLYLYDVKKTTFKRIDCSPIHHYVFTSKGFAVCHGSQPSEVTVFDLECNKLFSFPRGVRNRIFFNPHENVVVFGGFDNLSGDIEVFDVSSRRLVAKFNVLGASLVDWNENGSCFYVSTTSYFQEDNRITIYDYFGRVVGDRHFNSLTSVSTYGNRQAFVKLARPDELIIESQKKYVPPARHSVRISKKHEKPRVVEAKEVGKEVKIEDSHEETTKLLEKIQELKARMREGEQLSVEELNLILKESKLNSDLKKTLK